MRVETFERATTLRVSAAEAFEWHERPGALAALTPPWETVRVVSVSDGIRSGSRVVLRARVGPIWTTWVIEHYGYEAGLEFNDCMLRGPFPLWEHRHAFQDRGDGTCVLTDTIRYALPFGLFGRIFGGAFTRRKLDRLFAYRHAVTRAALGG
jgi:ligand-binding SRPBCC domain-containing protein